MGNDLGRAVVIAAQPKNLDLIRQLADQRQHLPMGLVQPAKIDGIKYIAVENEPGRRQIAVNDSLQQFADAPGLAVVAAEMNVRKNDGVKHGATAPRRATIVVICTPILCTSDERAMKSPEEASKLFCVGTRRGGYNSG